jgi:hypothetical protein
MVVIIVNLFPVMLAWSLPHNKSAAYDRKCHPTALKQKTKGRERSGWQLLSPARSLANEKIFNKGATSRNRAQEMRKHKKHQKFLPRSQARSLTKSNQRRPTKML